ncbi:cyclase family protein [Candidatus Saccharibacteria bacterium]|jgi:arylformamidase|nr:cyclase family protein [Candidatus Saccharimonas aalborgensis]QQR50934.1 MAG: cyclase family protein [Candidatus Saccharibacteria bacterium]QQS68680.1 MAG: cyclase family protein [Candidatus Saccharibacteria bacterium]QQS70982.1 MAG: cyclase family protein [Candidatus Saccharibacteria bacterium]
MKLIDISMDLNEQTVVWVEDQQPKLIPVARQPEAPVNFTWLDFGSHAGTHVDAPYYLFTDKWKSDEIPLDILMGECQVVDVTGVSDYIEISDLKKHDITSKRILLKTKNSYDTMKSYNPNHVALSEAAACYLRDLGITLIGFDYQSFERDGANVIHRIYMERDIISLDNLRLADAPAGHYTLVCLPIKVTGIDGAPARAILLEGATL